MPEASNYEAHILAVKDNIIIVIVLWYSMQHQRTYFGDMNKMMRIYWIINKAVNVGHNLNLMLNEVNHSFKLISALVIISLLFECINIPKG